MSQAYFLPHHPCYSRNVAKDRAWREYHLAVADENRGPDHPETVALWGRVKAFETVQPPLTGVPQAALVGYFRAVSFPGFDNRAARHSQAVIEVAA